ncbi:MAG: DNA translocase FtsK 4TM domain-containing protein, partial [Chthoniobacterales bacterium]|nr:DNA translocase FtsK 4TM domain-containing protein [Chthoniobacterales bacterium]
MARSTRNNAWNEVIALVLLGAGTLLFLALISYAPKDLPSWVPFSHLSPPNSPAQNFIGPLGAIVAGFCYFIIGGASYLLAVVLLGFGAAKLFYARLEVMRRAGWIALFIVSGACLLHLQHQFLRDWHSAFNIQGPGGWVGYYFGRQILERMLGRIGSLIVLTGVYVTSIILMTGLRPIHLVRQTVAVMRSAVQRTREWQLKRRMQSADIKGQLEISQRELVKQQRSIERQLKKKGAPVLEPTGSAISPEELANRPKPNIVDTTALPAENPGGRKK